MQGASGPPKTRSLSLLRPSVISVFLLLALYPRLYGAPSSFPKERRETRYGIFFLGGRIGTSTLVETPDRFHGKPALKVDSSTLIKIAALGEIEQKVDVTQYLDEGAAPLHLRFAMSSGGHTTTVVADFFADRVECELDSQGTKSKKTVEIPKGASLVADPQILGDRKLKVGDKQKLYLFEPMTLQVLPLDLEVLREEKLTLGGKTYTALVVKTVNSVTGEGTDWMTDDGQLLQGDTSLGIRMVREEAGAPETDTATNGQYKPPVDLAIATAVKTATTIESPRGVGYLRVRITGIPERRLILSDPRQHVTIEENNGAAGSSLAAVYEIRSDPADAPGKKASSPRRHGDHGENHTEKGGQEAARRSLQLSSVRLRDLRASVVKNPGNDSAPKDSDNRQYLAEAPYLAVNDPRIRAQSRQIVGTETDPARKAAKIRAWVHGQMKPKTNIGVLRSATDILSTPEGVCRDYAILFASLARAAGVPTRLCGGIVYFQGSFFYHAWNECLLDPSHAAWRAYDSTLPTDFVDATHIKFAQGDATDMFNAVRVVGQLKAEILEYR
jgi:Transglutaminase-like superfamily